MPDTSIKANSAFRPRARLLQLLGDQLIGSPRLAVFELVKNSYDADAAKVDVRFLGLDTPAASIEVRDDGEGMDLETIRNIWLEPGANHREVQKQSGIRTPVFGRLPLGEKGLGRFAVHKLGNSIELYTRRKDQPEYLVQINWSELIEKKYMDEAKVIVRETEGEIFDDGETGTKILITNLRSNWSRGELRHLYRNIVSITSPFKDRSDPFEVNMDAEGRGDWLAELMSMDDLLERAMWTYWFWCEDGKVTWKYKFSPLEGIDVAGTEIEGHNEPLKLIKDDKDRVNSLVATPEMHRGIGPVTGEFRIFDLDNDVLSVLTETKAMTAAIEENGGVRVYRDNVRVYNYGEPGNDWLGLDLRRVNLPVKRISNNLVIGAVDLSLTDSRELIEKTNREGFVENEAFKNFKAIVLAALGVLESNRLHDKARVKKKLADPATAKSFDILKPMDELRTQVSSLKVEKELAPYLVAVERKFNEMQEAVSRSGTAGLNLSMIFHEVERGVKHLNKSVQQGADFGALKKQSQRLVDLLGGFARLLRKDPKGDHNLREILEEVLFLNDARFENHDVVVSCPPVYGDGKSFSAKISFSMLLGVFSNLIDNALYWLDVKWPATDASDSKKTKRLYIDVSDDFEAGPAVVIADNGTGFSRNPLELVRPFMTAKPDGMGLGLYYASLVMELNAGQLVFPEPGDIELPDGMDGAVVALVFNGGRSEASTEDNRD